MITKLLLTVNKLSLFLSLIYTITLTAFSLFSLKKAAIDLPINSDKLMHSMAYLLFTILWFFAIFKHYKELKKALVVTVIFAFLYGILIEILQDTLTINRQADVFDVIANTLGIIIAAILILSIKKRLLKS